MRFMKYFRTEGPKKSAKTAKDRLHIIIAQQRAQKENPDFLMLLKQDILAAIAKHTHANVDNVHVDLQCRDNDSVLELNVVLPDSAAEKISEEAAEKA